MKTFLLAAAVCMAGLPGTGYAKAQPAPSDAGVFAAAAAIQPKVVAWRRDIHQHPELSNQEVRTAKLVADHLRRLGFEVRTGVAKNGVIGVLRGGRPGRTIALRADMDALPVAEKNDLPFASKATAQWNGETVPVMHACGHDAHVAMLMGAAEVLASMKAGLTGTVVFVFQPAEEGTLGVETWGAAQMLKENAFASPKPDAFFGIHVVPGKAGSLNWRSGPFMAGADSWELAVRGHQTHGGLPWLGIDAASVAADIVTSFNQLAARQMEVSKAPTVLSVGQIKLGVRHNIIPGQFDMSGTLRTFDPEMRKFVLARMEAAIKSMEVKYGVQSTFKLILSLPVTTNSAALSMQLAPTLERAAPGLARGDADFVMGSEDFAEYEKVAPIFFAHLGIGESAPNHSPAFILDETALEVGVRAHVFTVLDFLNGPAIKVN